MKIGDTPVLRGDRPTKLYRINNLHSTDTIDTENSGTRGRLIWVHSSQVRLLESSVPHNSLAGEGGAVGNGRGGQLGARTLLPRLDLSWPSPYARVGPTWTVASTVFKMWPGSLRPRTL